MALYFRNISSITDLRLGYIYASEDFQGEAKVEQIITTVRTYSIAC